VTIGTFNGQTIFIPQKLVPQNGIDFGSYKSVLKPRKRTNNKTYTAKNGAVIPGKTGTGGFGPSPTGGIGNSGGAAYITAEIAREVKDFDGCTLAVRSKLRYSDGSEEWMTWLEPDDSAIVELD